MLSSANYTRDESLIHVGEQIAPEMDLKDPKVKIYYSTVPNSRTHLPDGAEIAFTGGQFATANPEIKAFLDKIADKRGSLIYTKQGTAAVQEIANAAADAALPASDAVKVGSVADQDALARVAANIKTPQVASK